MLIQQGIRPAHTIVFESALGFTAAETRAIFIGPLCGPIAFDAFPVPIKIDEIAQRSLHQPPLAGREAPLPWKWWHGDLSWLVAIGGRDLAASRLGDPVRYPLDRVTHCCTIIFRIYQSLRRMIHNYSAR
jgi:hypothetical protein